MKYELWTDENIAEIEEEVRFKGSQVREITKGIIELIREANHRHEKEMLGKDAEIAELKGALKTFEYMAKGHAR